MSTAAISEPHRTRVGLLDLLRGLTLLSMIFYHATWNLVYLYHLDLPWFSQLPGTLWQKSICCCFILLSGFCWSLGKKPLLRGVQVFLAGAVVTAVTALFMPSAVIYFGVLTLLGTAMLLLIPAHHVLRQRHPYLSIALCLLLFFFFYSASAGYLGFGSLRLITLPAQLYQGYLAAFLGFPFAGFRSADYFPLLPWFFLFLSGYFLMPLLYKHLEKIPVSGRVSAPFRFLGRHSLLFYLLHQPVIYGVMTLVFS